MNLKDELKWIKTIKGFLASIQQFICSEWIDEKKGDVEEVGRSHDLANFSNNVNRITSSLVTSPCETGINDHKFRLHELLIVQSYFNL